MKFLFLTLILSTSAWAQTLCDANYATLPVQTGGRVKPLLVAADETMRFITGKTKPFEEDSVLSFCRLSFEGMGLPSNLDLPVKIEHVDAKKLVGIAEGESTLLLSKLAPQTETLRTEWQKRKENDAYKKELSKILGRLQVAEELKRGVIWTLPANVDGKTVWQTLPEFVREDKIAALKTQTNEPIAKLLADTREEFIKRESDHFMLEYRYYRMNPFLWAMLLGVVSLAVVFTVKNLKVAVSFSVVCIVIQLG